MAGLKFFNRHFYVRTYPAHEGVMDNFVQKQHTLIVVDEEAKEDIIDEFVVI